MAVSKKGSRKIVIDDHEFRWTASGSDEGINVIVWSAENSDCKILASINYHHDWEKIGEGHWASNSQLVVTNRVVREIILHVGIQKIFKSKGELKIGSIEDFYDINGAIRSEAANC